MPENIVLDPEVRAQYDAVHKDMGYFDRSNVGKLAIFGADRFSWLQGMVSNDVSLLKLGFYYGYFQACVLDATGHLLTDMALLPVRTINQPLPLVRELELPNEEFLLAILPRENVAKITAIFERFIIMEDVEVRDVSDALGCFSYQGPTASWGPHNDFPRRTRAMVNLRKTVYTWLADYTGIVGESEWPGFNVYFPTLLRSQVLDVLHEPDFLEIGTEAQEILRIEAGIPKYGADMDETNIALEANLGPTHISMKKGCYVGQEIIARIDSRGHTNRSLTGLVFQKGCVPAVGDIITATEPDGSQKETGRITSVCAISPAMQDRPIALGYVRHEHSESHARLTVGAHAIEAEIVRLPFFKQPPPKQY